jgi:tRNA U34 5-methylaminomethyl-2-thiouridine-forming methyltransferase MnmC
VSPQKPGRITFLTVGPLKEETRIFKQKADNMGLRRLFKNVALIASKQLVSDRGFDDGLHGRPPKMWSRDVVQELYDESYRRGQQAAKTRLLNRISNDDE